MNIKPEIGLDNTSFESFLNTYFETQVIKDRQPEISDIIEAIHNRHPVVINFLSQYTPNKPKDVNPYHSQFYQYKCKDGKRIKKYKYLDGHYAIVIGYDLHKKVLILNNPSYGYQYEIHFDKFLPLWRAYYSKHRYWMVVIKSIREKLSETLN